MFFRLLVDCSVSLQPVSVNVREKLFMIKLVKLMKINRITPAVERILETK